MITWLAYESADLLVRILPPRVADAIGFWLARAAFVIGLPHRRVLEENLSRLLSRPPGRPVREKAREGFVNFALMFIDFLRLGHLRREALARQIEVHGAEHLEAARRSGRGVILLSAHVGNWEMGVAWLAARGTRVNVVARTHASRRLERFFARRRLAWGIRPLPGRPLWKNAARALRRREWVALMADRGASAESAERRGTVCAWAAALAQRTGALVLPGVIVRLPDRRYAMYFDAPLAAEQVREGRSLEIIQEYLRRYPGQWFAFEPLPRGIV